MEAGLRRAKVSGLSQTLSFQINYRSNNEPTFLEETWPRYTADRGEYLGLDLNLAVRFKMRPKKMAVWNEFIPSIQQTKKSSITSYISTSTPAIKSSTSKPDDKKGIAIQPKERNVS